MTNRVITTLALAMWLLVFVAPARAATTPPSATPFCFAKLPIISWFFKNPDQVCTPKNTNSNAVFKQTVNSVNELLTGSAPSPTPTASTPPFITPNASGQAVNDTSNPGLTYVYLQPKAGRGITIAKNEISTSALLSLAADSGISVDGNTITNTDKGSSQSIFKAFHVSGQDSIKANGNDDALTLVAGSGVTLTTNAADKKLTITNSAGSLSSDGWGLNSSLISLSTTTNDVAIGTTTSLGKFSLVGTTDKKQFVLRGANSQTETLFDLQNNSGTSLASFSSAGVLSLPSNGLSVGTSQLVVSNGRVGIGTTTPGATLDVNGGIKVASNSGISLFSNNAVGTVSRLISLRATTKYDRPWISNIDYLGRHVVTFGALDTNNDENIHRRFELKTVGASGGPNAETLLTRLAIDYDRDLADIIFGQVDTIGVHNNYGDRIQVVHQMRDVQDIASHVIGQWITELGANDSTVMTFDAKTLTSTEAATVRFFRETQTSGQRRLVVLKGDGSATETFIVNADTGNIDTNANGEGLTMGDGTNVSSYINMQANRTMVGYDGSNATLQGGTNKGVKFNVNSSSFGAGTAMTIMSSGNVGIGTVTPTSLFSVGSGSPFQVNSSGAVVAATGLTSSGTITFSGLNVAGGVVYTDGSGVLTSVAGNAGECLLSNGATAPSWGACGAGTSQFSQSTGALYPNNATVDFLIGGSASTSAKFAFINNSGSGTPTASFSGNLVLNAAGSIQTTNSQALTIGGATTGNILLYPQNGTGRVGIGTVSPSTALHVASNGASLALGDGSNTSGYVNMQSNRTMVGYDGSFAVLQGGTSKGVKFNVNSSSFGSGTAMTILSNGNIGMGTVNPTLGPLEMASGAYVTSGGTWTNSSDRNLKTNFQDVNPNDILAKIAELPVTAWNYKVESSDVRHIGPMAQDFYALFGLGGSSTTISTIDPAGIALVGVKGLNSKLGTVSNRLQALELTTAQATAAASSPFADPTELNHLTVRDQFIAFSQALFRGVAVFEKTATFMADVVFKDKVAFTQAPSFPANTAGQAVIKAGANHVTVTFSPAYELAPELTVSLSRSDSLWSDQVAYRVSSITPTGFTITLREPASQDVTFSWIAVTVTQPIVSVGSESVSPPDQPQSDPAITVNPSPSPEVAGETIDLSSGEPTSSPLVEATATPSAENTY